MDEYDNFVDPPDYPLIGDCYNLGFSSPDIVVSELHTVVNLSMKCYPTIMKIPAVKILLIMNLCVVMIIGVFGNLLTLSSVSYCYVKCKRDFPGFDNHVYILMLHLSLCDLLYCLVGLPPQIYIYHSEGLPYSAHICKILSSVRNLIAYADFLSLATIALLRLHATVKRFDVFCFFKTFEKIPCHLPCPDITWPLLYCTMPWLLSLVIISPILFEWKTPVDWGRYGYNLIFGVCNTVTPKYSMSGISPNGLIYTIGFFVPFLAINISYCCIARIMAAQEDGGGQGQNLSTSSAARQRNLHITLTRVCGSYAIFTGPLIFVQWIEAANLELEAMIAIHTFGFAWYWWIYAINFIVYMRNQDFRDMYRRFLGDVYTNIKTRIKRMSNKNGQNSIYQLNAFKYMQ
eukprot:TRINITY_DN1911_c0_g1_i8.p1 TRINITY_DN1911_c0_g1~~TRINITY_DN1911_c0_g1_i8.p1  ORF type:complete len:402 (+),score=22.83 TRINITY_DN1911_c0_g1_i8:484-1689(+)